MKRITKQYLAFEIPKSCLRSKFLMGWAVVVVSGHRARTPTLAIWVQIPLKPTVFSVKFVIEKNKNKHKEAGVGLFQKSF